MLSFFNKKIRRSTKVFNKTFEEFKQTGVTPQEGHTALIDLFCRTNGKFNDTINNKIIGTINIITFLFFIFHL